MQRSFAILFFALCLSQSALAQYDSFEEKQKTTLAKDLYTQAAESFSKMECPDFSDSDGRFVARSFDKVYADKAWIKTLSEDINNRSFNRRVHLIANDEPSDDIQARGPGSYFWLQNGSIRREVFVGPYSNPIKCGPIQSMNTGSMTPTGGTAAR
jgi:hypothetical protein